MSATNRGGKRSPADFYATPAWPVKRLLEKCKLPTGGLWLEPGAGEGDIIRAVDRACIGSRPMWTAVELREECRPKLHTATDGIVAIGDFLTWEPSLTQKFDVAIGNPPFSLAMPFIERCIELAVSTVLLLRLDFLGSQKRCAFYRDHTPDVYVLPNRPSFAISAWCDDKKHCRWGATYDPRQRDEVPKHCPNCGSPLTVSTTDACDYGWFKFESHVKRHGELVILDETPASERAVWS